MASCGLLALGHETFENKLISLTEHNGILLFSFLLLRGTPVINHFLG
jgi:hypothetical protein